jgi:hypothetical protein
VNTKREAILQAFVATCEAAGTDAAVYRSRSDAIQRSEGHAIIVRPLEESIEKKSADFTMRDLTVELEVMTRGQVPDQDADPIVAAIHAAVTADLTLGGLVAQVIEDGTSWDFETADMDAVSVQMRYRVRYATPANSLAVIS